MTGPYAVRPRYEEDPLYPDERGLSHGGWMHEVVDVRDGHAVDEFRTAREAHTEARILNAEAGAHAHQ